MSPIDPRAFIRIAEAEATGDTGPSKRALRRVLEDPDNDFHRQVYADELDALGQYGRAEFIRVQCELAQLEKTQDSRPIPCPENAMMYDLAKRSRYLLRNNWDEWFPWAKPNRGHTFRSGVCTLEVLDGDGKHIGLETCGGFISRVECTLAQFMGGECERCHGHRDWQGALTGDGRCYDCLVTGRTLGLVDTLFSEQPVTEVSFTDLAIFEMAHGAWRSDRDQLFRYGLRALMSYEYATLEDARQAVSNFVVNLGRSRAGLKSP